MLVIANQFNKLFQIVKANQDVFCLVPYFSGHVGYEIVALEGDVGMIPDLPKEP
jgi:hypothetical protein